MSAIFIWIYSQEAKLFHLKPQSIHVETVKRKDSDSKDEVLFKSLVERVQRQSLKRLLLMGPGSAPQHFFRYLQTHQPEWVPMVIGVERVEHMPDSEILSMGRHFLQQFYLNQNIAK